MVLDPAWFMRAHNMSTGDRSWFTITAYIRRDGKTHIDITLEGKNIDPTCYEVAPGCMICRIAQDFIRVNKQHLKNRENYGAQLKFDAAFSFIEEAINEDPDHQWESL